MYTNSIWLLYIGQVYDSPTLPESEFTFALGGGGIEDAKDL